MGTMKTARLLRSGASIGGDAGKGPVVDGGSGGASTGCVKWACEAPKLVFGANLVKGTQNGRGAAQVTLKTLRMGCPTPADGAPQPADGFPYAC